MPEPEKLDSNLLVSTLLEGGPSLPWTLKKRRADGKIVEVPYRAQVIRAEEDILALKDAQESAKTIGELPGYGDIYKESQAHQILLRVIRHHELRERNDGTTYYPPVFTTVEQLRASLTTLEMAALMNAYEITKATFAVVDGLEEHDAESWIARLSDPLRGPFRLSELDSHHWPGLILLLARIARALYEELGRPLPSSDDSSESAPASSTSSTGSSGLPPSASNTGTEETVETLGDKQISADEAREIVAKRKGKPDLE